MALFDFVKKLRRREKEKKPDGVAPSATPVAAEITMAIPETALLSPHVTERARDASAFGRYTFRVSKDATKFQVKKAVEELYRVNVESVNIIHVHEKPRRRGLTEGVKRGYKKAVVALKKGEAIDIF